MKFMNSKVETSHSLSRPRGPEHPPAAVGANEGLLSNGGSRPCIPLHTCPMQVLFKHLRHDENAYKNHLPVSVHVK
jgi:hypothetical protein